MPLTEEPWLSRHATRTRLHRQRSRSRSPASTPTHAGPAATTVACGLTLDNFQRYCDAETAALAAMFRDPVTCEFIQTCPVHARLRGRRAVRGPV